ncbi:HAMP domain-containing sensor histidine kinase [Actinocrispum sp. NPDC049592]|uniref:sensor histidine kinase n=1 Tax=Actinocrispum sp. NPDC049592 TaxID=3154835 RepID=UPI0034455C36
MRRLGLRARIIAAVVLVTLTATVAMAFTAYLLQENKTKERFARAATAEFDTDIHQATEKAWPQSSPVQLNAMSTYMGNEAGTTWSVLNLERVVELKARSTDHKIVVGGPTPGLLLGTRVTAIPVSVLDQPQTRREQEMGSWYVISQQVGSTSVLLVKFYDLQPMRDDLSTLRWQLAFVATVVALLGVGAALLAAGRIHRPVRHAAAAAQSVGDGRFDVRLPVRGRDELANLADSFNAMAGRLQAKDEQQRRFVSDVAHDLRTPVASVVAAADSLQDDDPAVRARSAELIGTQSRRLARLVEDLLEMSRFDAGVLVLEPEPVDLPAMVADAVELTAPDAHVTVSAEGDTVIEGDPRRLHTVVCNLLANAVHHGAEPVCVTIDGTQPDKVTISVADSGPGIPAEVHPILFDRFTRGDRARRPSEGSGLGLAIARENVRLHGGRIEASTEDGAVLTVTLPR